MDVYDTNRTMLAVRRYQERPIPEDVVQRIVEAGHLTGSSRNLQPWHFVVVQDRQQLQALASRTPTGPFVAGAPLAIVVAHERESRFGVSDASRAAQSMMLVAWEAGVGSNWAGFGGLEQVREFLGMPAELDVLAVLAFGYPADRIGFGKKNRKPLGEVAHRERWGQPFA